MPISQDPSRAEFKYLVERQREEIRTINEVSRLLRKSSQPQELVRLVANYLQQTFPLALFGVLLPEQKTLQLIQFVRIAQADMEKAVQELAQSQELIQLLEDASAKPGQWTPAGAAYLRSSHFIPLVFNNKPVGRLGLFTPKETGFSEEDQHVLGIVADRLGVALHNALLLEELRRADRMKNDLMAILSHELRIPLTAIQEGSGLLLEGVLGPINDEQKDFLGTVANNAVRLQKLIEKVELAAQLIAGKITYHFKATDLGELLKELETNFQPMAKSREVQLSFSGPGKPAPGTVDKERLTEAAGQIIENALQATPPKGSVTVGLSEIPQGLEISVSDTGKGIPAEEIPKQFDQFFQVGGTGDRKTGGLGLGLFMASKILAGHGGLLKLESQVGTGTKVTLQFPKEPAPAPS